MYCILLTVPATAGPVSPEINPNGTAIDIAAKADQAVSTATSAFLHAFAALADSNDTATVSNVFKIAVETTNRLENIAAAVELAETRRFVLASNVDLTSLKRADKEWLTNVVNRDVLKLDFSKENARARVKAISEFIHNEQDRWQSMISFLGQLYPANQVMVQMRDEFNAARARIRKAIENTDSEPLDEKPAPRKTENPESTSPENIKTTGQSSVSEPRSKPNSELSAVNVAEAQTLASNRKSSDLGSMIEAGSLPPNLPNAADSPLKSIAEIKPSRAPNIQLIAPSAINEVSFHAIPPTSQTKAITAKEMIPVGQISTQGQTAPTVATKTPTVELDTAQPSRVVPLVYSSEQAKADPATRNGDSSLFLQPNITIFSHPEKLEAGSTQIAVYATYPPPPALPRPIRPIVYTSRPYFWPVGPLPAPRAVYYYGPSSVPQVRYAPRTFYVGIPPAFRNTAILVPIISQRPIYRAMPPLTVYYARYRFNR